MYELMAKAARLPKTHAAVMPPALPASTSATPSACPAACLSLARWRTSGCSVAHTRSSGPPGASSPAVLLAPPDPPGLPSSASSSPTDCWLRWSAPCAATKSDCAPASCPTEAAPSHALPAAPRDAFSANSWVCACVTLPLARALPSCASAWLATARCAAPPEAAPHRRGTSAIRAVVFRRAPARARSSVASRSTIGCTLRLASIAAWKMNSTVMKPVMVAICTIDGRYDRESMFFARRFGGRSPPAAGDAAAVATSSKPPSPAAARGASPRLMAAPWMVCATEVATWRSSSASSAEPPNSGRRRAITSSRRAPRESCRGVVRNMPCPLRPPCAP